MYRQPSKKKILLQRFAVYGLMTLSVIGLVIVLVFVMLGYQFNSDDGRIEQGGLVQFDSHPSGADVTIDGNPFGTRTASKTTMNAGNHTVSMSKSGYATWKKNITVVPGSVLWLNYTRLIPTSLKPANVADFSSVSGAVTSSDEKTVAVKEDAASPSIKLVDISKDTVESDTITIPESAYSASEEGKNQQFILETWDPDDRYLLVKHVYSDTNIEWLVVDTDSVNATKNVTKLLDVNAADMKFSNADSRVVYAKIGTDVRKINLNDATLSRPLVTNVASFDLYSDSMVTYTTQRDEAGKRSVGYYIDGSDAPRTIKTYEPDDNRPLLLTVGRYFNETYQAIAYGDTVSITNGDLPRDEKTPIKLTAAASMTIEGGASYLTDKTNGRFIVAQNGPVLAVYDLELGKHTTTMLKGSSAVSKEIQWIDGYMFWGDRDTMLRLYEFDGTNSHDIMQVVPGMTATLSPSGKYLYGVTGGDGKYFLTRVQLQL